ncbi:ABC transporter permease, partial [Corynebacterium amycolatum]
MSTATTETKKASPAPKAVAVIFGIPLVIGLMLFAFLAPTFASGPKDVPIALTAPAPMSEQITQAIEHKAGDNAPDIQVMDTPDAVRESILNRETVGGIVISPTGATAYTASGNGAPYSQLIDGIATTLESQNIPVEREDLAPTTQDDPQASGVALLGLPLAFGGIISAVIATFLFRGKKWTKLSVLTGIAVFGALVATWMLHSVYGTLSGSFGMEWLAISLGILATSMLTAGLAAIIGTPGVGIGLSDKKCVRSVCRRVGPFYLMGPFR